MEKTFKIVANNLRGVWIFKYGCFFGKIPKEGGRGVISIPKNYIADFFGFKTVYFGRKSNPKIVIANLCKLAHIYKLSQKKHNVIFKKGQGGSRPFGNFPKKHPYLGRQMSLR